MGRECVDLLCLLLNLTVLTKLEAANSYIGVLMELSSCGYDQSVINYLEPCPFLKVGSGA